MDRSKSRGGKSQRREEKRIRKKKEERRSENRKRKTERVRRKKTQAREKVDKSQKHCVFPMFCGSGGSKSIGSLKRRARSHLGR